MPQISVIIPVYNTEKYIRRSIESILAQTFTDFELILVDDGSKDNSGAICDEYAQMDRRVTVIHKKNNGVSSARNAGLECVNGKYVMFCDADDWVAPKWCEAHYQAIEAHPRSWIVSGVVSERNNREIGTTVLDEPELKKEDYFLIYKHYLSPYCFNKIYRLDLIRDNSVLFDPNISNGEDIKFNLEYVKLIDSIVTIPEALYHYNRNDGITTKYNPARINDSRYAFSVRLPFIEKKYLREYCTMWAVTFLNDLKCVFDERNTMSREEKYRFCDRAMASSEFAECIKYADLESFNPLYRALIKIKKYWLIRQYDLLREARKKRSET